MLASMFALSAVNSPFLPDRLPSHWTGGQVGSYAAKSTVLLFWPLFAAGTYAAFLIAARRHVVGAAMPAIISDRLAASPAQWESRTEPSWVQSHRLCGKALVACGTVVIGGSLLGVTVRPPVALAALVAGAVALQAHARWKR